MLVWNPYGAWGVFALACAWAFAVIVYQAAPRRFQNRVLALLLVAEGLAIGTGEGLIYLMSPGPDVVAAQLLTAFGSLAVPPLYLLLISTLETRLAAPLRVRGVRPVLLALAAVLPFAVIAWPAQFCNGIARDAVTGTWDCAGGPWFLIVIRSWSVVSLYGLVAAMAAWRASPPRSAARERGRWFAYAFGLRDVLLVLLIVNMTWGPFVPSVIATVTWPLVTLLFVAVASYGVARTQLFDIDLRIKRGLRASTLTAMFVALFFIVSESAAAFLSARVGTYLGIAAAGLMLFALAPLQRLAERFSDVAMPRVEDTPAYAHARKLSILRAALEGAYDDGEVTPKEREMVRRLQLELGIANEEVARIEADLGHARAGA